MALIVALAIAAACDRTDTSSAPVLASVNTHLDAARFYTIVIVGTTQSTPSLDAFLIEDALSR